MMARWLATIVTATALLAGCAAPSSAPSPSPQPAGRPTSSGGPIDGSQAERIQRVMVPLIQAMNKPIPLNRVKIGILDDASINAANAGNGEFYVTRGLLEKATDEHLTGVLAHEVAHEDLGHVAKAQTLGAGLNIGMVILDQIIPGSGALTPIAGELIARKYSRSEEYAADRHGVDLLKRTGKSKETMIATLSWLMQTEGTSGGGFFATHPATEERLQALRDLK